MESESRKPSDLIAHLNSDITPEEQRMETLMMSVRTLLANTPGLSLDSGQPYRLELEFIFDGDAGYATSVKLEGMEKPPV